MLTAFKKLPWESCATASYLRRYWPPLSLSIACVSVCLQASQSGSVTLCCFSSWLLLSSFHHPALSSALPFLSYISTPLLFFPHPSYSLFLFPLLFLWSLPVFPQFPRPMISLLHLLSLSLLGPPTTTTTSSLLPTPLLLTVAEERRWIRCKLKFTSK